MSGFECDRCELANPVFAGYGPIVFRRAESDGEPAMAIPFGEREALLPLRALQREHGIAEASADGRMLGLIAEALAYVDNLRLGDRLPPEVLTGEASWSPAPRHQALAEARLHAALLSAFPSGGYSPGSRSRTALAQAAERLGLPEADAVSDRLRQLAEQLAYIESLRESLLVRLRALCRALQARGIDWNGSAERRAMQVQVWRLAKAAGAQIAARFAAVDEACGNVVAALQQSERMRALIHAHRDWLYCTLRVFGPVLEEWGVPDPETGDIAGARLARTYQFLAPRYMVVHAWDTPGESRGGGVRRFGPVMQW